MTESKYGDYQLDLDGLENTIDVGTDQIYGVIVSTKEGNDYGMRHVEKYLARNRAGMVNWIYNAGTWLPDFFCTLQRA